MENRPVTLSAIHGPKEKRDWRSAGGAIFLVLVFLLPVIMRQFRGAAYLLAFAFGFSFLGLVVYYYTRVAKPEAHVTLDSNKIHPGATVGATWQIIKNARTARRVRISLLGYEKAKDDRGSSTSIYEEVFYREQVTDLRLNGRTASSLSITIPQNAYPSLRAKRNFVIWALQFRFDFSPIWPNHVKTYGFNVLPFLPDDAYQALQESDRAQGPEQNEEVAQLQANRDQAPAVVKSLMQWIIDSRFSDAPPEQITLGPHIEHNWAPPPGEVQIELNGRFAFGPGETLHGMVSWQLSEPVDHLDLRMRWFTSGKGDPEERVVQVIPRQFPSQTDRMPFELTLPTWPHSLEGKYISIDWVLDLAVRLPDEQRRSLRQWVRGRSYPEVPIIISPTRDRIITDFIGVVK